MTRLFYGVLAGNRQADKLFNDRVFVLEELNGVNRDNRGTVRPGTSVTFPEGCGR